MDILGKFYFVSGIVNTFGLLTFNKFYTNTNALSKFAPNLFGIESQLLINVWGLAYISVAKYYLKMPYLSLVFFAEKMLYVYWWIKLLQDKTNLNKAFDMIGSGKTDDMLIGTFVLLFGLNDLFFGLIFLLGAIKGFKYKSNNDKEE